MNEINLNLIYSDLLNGKKTCEEVSEIMKSSQIRSLVNSYINKDRINKLIPYFESDLQNIYMIINITQYIFNNSGCDTGLSDSEYDALYSIMIANGGADVISVPITPNSKNGITHHTYPSLRGTLTKTYYLTESELRTNPSRRYLDEWKNSMESKIFTNSGRHVNLDNEEIYVFPKFDGVSGIFEMNPDNSIDKVLTRGFTETNEAEDISHVFRPIFNRKYQEIRNKKYGLKTEIMMKESDLKYYNEKYNTDYKNTRSIVSAIINSDVYDPETASLLHVVPLRVGYEDGSQEVATEAFKDYPYLRCRLKDRERIREFALSHRYIYDELRCDGAVIYIINPEIQEILGRENEKNNFEVAYKFTEESEMSKLLDVTFQMGVFGRLTPVAQIKPVKLKGNTINNISLGSIGRVKSLKLHKGDKIKVLYDIIPYMAFDSDCKHNMNGDEITIPTICPECGSELIFSENGDIASCNNPKCPCIIKGKIINYLDKMRIKGLSYGIIDKLYDHEIVTSIKDLYSLKKHFMDITNIDGLGPKMIQSWIDELNAHSIVQDYVLLGSIGIEGLSKKTFEKVMNEMTIEEMLDYVDDKAISRFIKIPGIQEKSARKLVDGISENKKLIKFLIKNLDVIDSHGNTNNKKLFSVCFTKVRDNELEDKIVSIGGEIKDSITKDTMFLVVPSSDTSSSKIDKAKKYGVEIVPIDVFKQFIISQEFLNSESSVKELFYEFLK